MEQKSQEYAKIKLSSIKAQLKKNQTLVFTLLFLSIGFLALAGVDAHSNSKQGDGPTEISTIIPSGFQLVPIEIQNWAQLDGVVQDHAIVDLYENSSLNGGRSKLVGKRMRLLRAPLNPKVFAVLVRNDEAAQVLSFHGPFIASLRSAQEHSHEVMRFRNSSVHIEFQAED